ncbi:hypothetical protein OG909_12880 [Streptomyces sp. NBC_01754]|nr:hypothetical protein [Streptomyces sp. NBC_01754]WSC93115.1 hypothetical protein OG909_12880 [Streptomyces sp. NBC_01754]
MDVSPLVVDVGTVGDQGSRRPGSDVAATPEIVRRLAEWRRH